MAALHLVVRRESQIIAQVIETQLVVGGVSDVGGVGLALFPRRLARHDDADAEAKETVDAPHPFRIATRQVVVDRDDVYALAGQRIEVGGQRGDQGLALAGAHFGNLALVQHRGADQLHVEVAHPQHAPAGLAHHRERFRQQAVERLALAQALAEQTGLRRQIGIAHRLVA